MDRRLFVTTLNGEPPLVDDAMTIAASLTFITRMERTTPYSLTLWYEVAVDCAGTIRQLMAAQWPDRYGDEVARA